MASDSISNILSFLYENKYYRSLFTLEQESGEKHNSFGKELDFLYDLISEGRFEESEKLVEPLKPRSEPEHNRCLYALRRQNFLEKIETAEPPSLEELIPLLKGIESVSTKEDFGVLLECLSLTTLNEHAELTEWNIWSGRFSCFSACRSSLKAVYKPVPSMTTFNPTDLQELLSLPTTATTRSCCFSPSGHHLALGSTAKSLQIYSLALITQSELAEGCMELVLEIPNAHCGSVYSMDWATNQLLATGSNDKTIKFWAFTHTYEYSAHIVHPAQGAIRALAFNSLVLASGGTSADLKLWDSATGQCFSTFLGHSATINSIVPGPQPGSFLSAGSDKRLILWDSRSSSPALTIETVRSVVSLAYSAPYISVSDVSGSIAIYDLFSRSVYNTYSYHSAECKSLSMSSDWLLSSSLDSSIGLLHITTSSTYKIPCTSKCIASQWHPTLPLIITCSLDRISRILAV